MWDRWVCWGGEQQVSVEDLAGLTLWLVGWA